MFYSVFSQCVFIHCSFSRLPNCENAAGRQLNLCSPHGHRSTLSPISDLPFHSAKTVLNSFLKGEEEDQFLKDSAQDLKNRRNKNKVGPQSLLCPNIYSCSRDRSLVRSAKAVDTTVTGGRGGGDRC